MMTCEEVERDEVVEQYVLGHLETADQVRFEDHYFNCTRCLERLRVVEEARTELARQEMPARSPRWRRAAAALAAAAVVVLAIRVGHDVWTGGGGAPPSATRGVDVTLPGGASPDATSEQPVPNRLGEIELPPYTPPRLRGTSTEAQRVFREAMTSYVARDCAAALPGLRRALMMDDALIQARFYLAVCELQGNRVADAARHLERVIAAGESPYLEDAHFFLAKARILQGNVEGARQELSRVVSLRGDRREEARRLLDELR